MCSSDREPDVLMSEEVKTSLRRDLVSSFKEIGVSSAVESDLVRNKSSNINYLITNNTSADNAKVKIEMPHLEKAQCIPLRFTPVYVTKNDTIQNVSDTGRVTDLILYRMKFGQIVERTDKLNFKMKVEDDTVKVLMSGAYIKVSADFIDLNIPTKKDSGLLDFVERGGFNGRLNVNLKFAGCDVTVPSIYECLEEYRKLVYVYDTPDCKKAKRLAKYEAISSLIAY
jgi:hypothetical protein